VTTASWKTRPPGLPLPGSHEVHIWRLSVSEPAAIHGREELSSDEKIRADRFRQQEDRWRFTVGRAALRSILGEYLGVDPRSLFFTHSETGKPALGATCNPSGLAFSVAHSGECALLACGLGLSPGVDIEDLRIDRDIDLLAKSLLLPSDYAQALLTPAEMRKRKLLQEWTRREAVGKALGGGIAAALCGYQVAFADSAGWSIRNLDMGQHYVAAVAAQTPDLQPCLYERQDGSNIP
jgi:4'-phosphopantetheinyl transferase